MRIIYLSYCLCRGLCVGLANAINDIRRCRDYLKDLIYAKNLRRITTRASDHHQLSAACMSLQLFPEVTATIWLPFRHFIEKDKNRWPMNHVYARFWYSLGHHLTSATPEYSPDFWFFESGTFINKASMGAALWDHMISSDDKSTYVC